jgi:hypothetical protein
MRNLSNELYISILEKIILKAYVALNDDKPDEAKELLKSFVDASTTESGIAKVVSDEYIVSEWVEGDFWRVVNRTTGQYANMTFYEDRRIAQAEANRLNGLSD